MAKQPQRRRRRLTRKPKPIGLPIDTFAFAQSLAGERTKDLADNPRRLLSYAHCGLHCKHSRGSSDSAGVTHSMQLLRLPLLLRLLPLLVRLPLLLQRPIWHSSSLRQRKPRRPHNLTRRSAGEIVSFFRALQQIYCVAGFRSRNYEMRPLRIRKETSEERRRQSERLSDLRRQRRWPSSRLQAEAAAATFGFWSVGFAKRKAQKRN